MPVANRNQSNLDYISQHYGVAAEIGGRVEFETHPGTIVGTTGHYLRIKLDDWPEVNTFHPTWHLRYLTPPSNQNEVVTHKATARRNPNVQPLRTLVADVPTTPLPPNQGPT